MCLFFFIKKQREKKGRPDTSARAQEDKSPSSISRRAAPLVLWTAVLIVADTHKGGLSANTTLVPQIEFTRRTPRGMTMYGAAYFCWRNIYSSLCGSDGGLAVEETDGGCWLRWHMMMGGGGTLSGWWVDQSTHSRKPVARGPPRALWPERTNARVPWVF